MHWANSPAHWEGEAYENKSPGCYDSHRDIRCRRELGLGTRSQNGKARCRKAEVDGIQRYIKAGLERRGRWNTLQQRLPHMRKRRLQLLRVQWHGHWHRRQWRG